MKESTKKWMHLLSWLPLISMAAFLVHFMIVSRGLIAGEDFEQHQALSSLIFRNFGGLFITLSIAFILHAVVLLYFAVHLTRLRDMNSNTKILWLILLTALGPLTFMFFWYYEIRNEPEDVGLYPSIE